MTTRATYTCIYTLPVHVNNDDTLLRQNSLTELKRLTDGLKQRSPWSHLMTRKSDTERTRRGFDLTRTILNTRGALMIH